MKGSKRIAFVGDSVTEFFDWQRRFPEYEVMNLGIAGETIEGLSNRMDRILIGLHNPAYIFLMTGINNIAMEDYDILGEYKKIINRFFSSFHKSIIVVQSILPVSLPWVDNGRIRDLNNSLIDTARNFAATYLDLYSLFSDVEGNPIAGYLLDDGVHLSDKGYDVWAKEVEGFLKENI